MRKSLLALALGMLVASSALAQTAPPRNEFFVGIGDASLVFTFVDIATTVGSLGLVSYGDADAGLQYVAGYQRHFGWASLGVTGSWASDQRPVRVGGEARGDAKRTLSTVLLDARGHWVHGRTVDLYSGLGIGYAHWTDDWEDLDEKVDESHVGFHVIPLGLRVGRSVGVFVETGVGWHNLIKAGLSGRW